MSRRTGLGKGLEALFDDNSTDNSRSSQIIRLSDIEPNKGQPRQEFDKEALSTLADSIKQHGLLQPLVVRPLPSGAYQIVAGERRWRACRMLGIDEVPVFIKELTDAQTMQIALIENLQRENLNPLEEAQGFRELMDNYSMTQEDVAKTIGRSRSAVANSLRLLALPSGAMRLLKAGDITAGHAKALLSIADKELADDIASRAAKGELTVRDIEKIAAKHRSEGNADKKKAPSPTELPDSFYKEMEIGLRDALGKRVKVTMGSKKGSLEIEFTTKEELSDLAKLLTSEI